MRLTWTPLTKIPGYAHVNSMYLFTCRVKNSVDPDQKPADLDLHCLNIGYIRVYHPRVSCVNY